MRLLLWTAALLLVAGAAQAEWTTCPATHAAGEGIGEAELRASGHDRKACYDFTDATASGVLDVTACENVDVRFDPDLDGTNATATVQIMGCTAPTASANACEPIEDATLDGESATGTDAINGAGEAWLYVNPQTGAGGDEARVLVVCNP